MKNKPPIGFDDELRQLRTMLSGANQSPAPKGIRGFFHRLAQRLAVPRKKLIMKRVQDAEPVKPEAPKKDAA
jgi:hypothetical protein